MLCRCVRQSITKTYPSMTSPSTRRGARSRKSAGRKSRKTGPNWCAKLSNRCGSSVRGTIDVSRFQKLTGNGRLIGASTSSRPDPPNQLRKNG